ncbi:MAG: adenosylcobalamin-dependent ribonucleoside-diphosphate reductase [Candidatus Aenigmarchaeota archaeon]|nr:adenosylcobalamin-dependent ribonucleoside-diphosphate reductase [Candidatus Aenigmarchaeota archaeon]
MEKEVKFVKKRNGRIVKFDVNKVANAIFKAAQSVEGQDFALAKTLADKVAVTVNEKFDGHTMPGVEQIQDIVEKTLIENGHAQTAKAYILYRDRQKMKRETKYILGVTDELKLPINSIKVLKSRYLLKDDKGQVTETTMQFFRRIARHLALVDILYHEYVYDKERGQTVKHQFPEKDLDESMVSEIGLNIHNLRMLYMSYNRLNTQKHMKVSFKELIEVTKNRWEYIQETENEFYDMMSSFGFLPNSPTLMNAGTHLGQLSACFVLPVHDDITSIFDAVKNTAIIHQSGGGTGFSFSELRPKGDVVKSTKGVASGPISFMRVFDVSTEVIKQGGKRRGANMGILSVSHPDILEFITAKNSENTILTNFNISVAVNDDFMRAIEKKKDFSLVNPRTGTTEKSINAKQLWDMIIYQAWKTGDPGVIFIDEINRHNQTPLIGRIESTNPCGEQPLLPYESCNLGSINLSKCLKKTGVKYEIDWENLGLLVEKSVHFLDNVIDGNNYPIKQIEFMTRANRKVGLGVMGWADMLIMLGIPYASKDAVVLAEKVMKFISEKSIESSSHLADIRGNFPNFVGSEWDKRGFKSMRNATVTTIAPTGTISIIANATSGIEPLFAVAFMRKNILGGEELMEINPLFERIAKEKRFFSGELMKRVAERGSLHDIEEIPRDVKDLFVTSHDIEPEWHIKMQAAFQRYTDNAVSKTINIRNEATIEEVERAYLLAHRLKCKGITIYRDSSKVTQVLNLGNGKKEKEEARRIKMSYEKDETILEQTGEKCPVCDSKLYYAEGCSTCLSCGYSKCG